MKRLAGFLISSAIVFLATSCSETADNTNLTNTNVSNRAVPTNSNENANSMAMRNSNSTSNSNHSLIPTREEYEKSKEKYGSEAKSAGSKIGSGLEDGWLWTKTRYELAAADDLRDSTINVDVDNAVVTLRGTVANQAQRIKAVETAKGISGVKSVKDELKLSASGSTNTNSNTSVKNTNMAAKNKKP